MWKKILFLSFLKSDSVGCLQKCMLCVEYIYVYIYICGVEVIDREPLMFAAWSCCANWRERERQRDTVTDSVTGLSQCCVDHWAVCEKQRLTACVWE